MASKKPDGKLPATLRKLIITCFTENKLMNAAKKGYESAREDLFAGMKEEAIDSTTIVTTIDGVKHSITAKIEVGGGKAINEVDVRKLKALVDDETFLSIVSASQAAVKEHCPETILKQCIVSAGESKRTENVTVKATK